MKDFRNLTVWERAHKLTLKIYSVTSNFPKDEQYGLTSQVRRCSASIAANIAEGCGRRGNGEFHRFLQTAGGSASELDYHLLLASDLQFLKRTTYEELSNDLLELRRMPSSLTTKVDAERSSCEGILKQKPDGLNASCQLLIAATEC